jgi:hypothetical protein
VDALLKFGFGINLAFGLAFYGGAISGNLLAFSIGGKPSLAQGGVTGILTNGLSGSHNKYEGDASATRKDLYEPLKEGEDPSNVKTVPSLFKEMIDISPGGLITMDSLVEYRSKRFDTQVQNNPYFFRGPVSGVLVAGPAYQLIYRIMANHSEEAPKGIVDVETAKSWFGIKEVNGQYVAEQGQERIPDNWVSPRSVIVIEVKGVLILCLQIVQTRDSISL